MNDPDGHFWGLVAKAAIGAVINVAVTAVCDYLDDGEFNSGAGEYLSAAATGALSAVISPAKCAENIAKRMVKSGLKEAAIGAVGDGIKQLADGEFDPKEMAINAGKNFVSGALNGKFNASCFTAGTMIETADGDRTIEEIQIGDLVLSANPETGEIAYKPVVNTYVHVTDTVLYLTIDEEIIETTEDHPFWVEGQGWTSAKLLQPGDVVRLKDGSTQCVDDIEIVELPEGEYVAVYNFEVADFHTYFVSDYDILVHNKCKKPNGYETGDIDRHGNLSPQKNRKVGHTNSATDGYVQSHHIIQDEWAVKNIPSYRRNDAPAILLKSKSGSAHALISSSQRKRRKTLGYATSLRDEFNFSYSSMIDAGVSKKSAQKAIKKSYKYFNSLGAI